MAYRLRIGSYDFPATLRPASSPAERDVAEQERPREEGSILGAPRDKSRVFQVRGSITAASPDALDTLCRAIKKACYGGGSLWFGRDDRYLPNAVCTSFAGDHEDGLLYGLITNLSIGFTAERPFEVAISATTVTLATTGGTVADSGDAPALPSWNITINAAGSGPLTLENSTTGETATIGTSSTSFTAGQVIVLNRDGNTVTRGGAAEPGLLSAASRIPKLNAGNNTITLTAGGTATISAFSATFTPRY